MLESWLFLLVVLPNISLLAERIAAYDEQRLIMLLLATILMFIHYRRLPLPQPAALYITVALIGLLSVVTAVMPAYAALEWALFVCIVALGLLLGSKTGDEYTVRNRVLPALALGVVLYGLIALVIVFSAWHLGERPVWPAIIHRFPNIRFLNQYQSWVLPFMPVAGYALMPYVRSSIIKALFYSYFALLFALLFYSGGRGTQLGLFIAVLVVLVLFGRAGRRWALMLAACALVGLGMAYQIFTAQDMDKALGRVATTIAAEQGEVKLSGRGRLWQRSLEIAKAHPLLGMGPMGFATLSERNAHPHNFPLQFAAEWGLPATILLLTGLAYALWKWLYFAFHRVRTNDCPAWERSYIISLTASMITAGIHSLLSGIVVMPVSQALLILVIALALGWYRRYHTVTKQDSALAIKAWRGMTLAAAVWLLGFTGYALTDYEANIQASKIQQMEIRPRFWHRGSLLNNYMWEARESFRHPHNGLLQSAAEWGIPAA